MSGFTPEKNSKARILRISRKCAVMLQNLPKTSEKVFGYLAPNTMRSNLLHSRQKLARKLNNPRLLQIHFHTLRHWKATMLYHQTKDPFYVKDFLGHKKLENILIYVHIEHALFRETTDEFTCKVAKTVKEAKALVEVGFEYICDIEGAKLFRKTQVARQTTIRVLRKNS